VYHYIKQRLKGGSSPMLQYVLFITIACLNAIDGLATAYGLQLDLVEEQNPFALYLWEVHPLLFISVKLFISLIVLYFPLFTKRSIWQKKFWTITLITVTLLYLFVNIVHLIWLSIHFNFITL